MAEIQMGMVEAKFADIIWQHAPVTSSQLVKLGEAELGWKRTTTYTVIQIDGSRVVIGINGVVTAAVNIKDLTLVG